MIYKALVSDFLYEKLEVNRDVKVIKVKSIDEYRVSNDRDELLFVKLSYENNDLCARFVVGNSSMMSLLMGVDGYTYAKSGCTVKKGDIIDVHYL